MTLVKADSRHEIGSRASFCSRRLSCCQQAMLLSEFLAIFKGSSSCLHSKIPTVFLCLAAHAANRLGNNLLEGVLALSSV